MPQHYVYLIEARISVSFFLLCGPFQQKYALFLYSIYIYSWIELSIDHWKKASKSNIREKRSWLQCTPGLDAHYARYSNLTSKSFLSLISLSSLLLKYDLMRCFCLFLTCKSYLCTLNGGTSHNRAILWSDHQNFIYIERATDLYVG